MWNLWQRGSVLQEIILEEPLLDPWQKSTHPAQIALQSYVSNVSERIQTLSHEDTPLFIHMCVDQQYLRERRRGKGDLENYLSPVAKILSQRMKFTLVSGEFCEGSGSTLSIGRAILQEGTTLSTDWNHLTYIPTAGYSTTSYKQSLVDVLEEIPDQCIPIGNVQFHIAVQCNPKRVNWMNLWKPTGDSLGPIVGNVEPPRIRQPFNPRDERINRLDLHLCTDSTMGNRVQVGLWWQEA